MMSKRDKFEVGVGRKAYMLVRGERRQTGMPKDLKVVWWGWWWWWSLRGYARISEGKARVINFTIWKGMHPDL